MSIEELNRYLQTNVKCSFGRCSAPAPFVDEFDVFRRDDTIYCYSAMIELIKQTSSNINFRQWLLHRKEMLAQYSCYAEPQILVQTYNAVKSDGDDLCDEQSVGWYLGVYTYLYCLIYDIYDYEQIFCEKMEFILFCCFPKYN